MPRPSDPGRQGVVLVLVLIFLLSLSGLVMATLTTSSRGALETSSLPPEYQAGLLAESALAMAKEILLQDIDPTSDTPQEPWARPYQTPGLTFRIVPANAFLDLNRFNALPTTNATSGTASVVDTSFSSGKSSIKDTKVFGVSEREKSTEASAKEAASTLDKTKEAANLRQTYRLELALNALLGAIPDKALMIENARDWVHNSSTALAKFPRYQEKQPTYFPGFRPLKVPEELLLVLGWERTPAHFIRTHFTVWGGGRQINLNFAPPEVLQAYLPELNRHLESILFWRQQKGFTHVSQLLSATTMVSDGEEYGAALPNLTVISHVFQVEVEARAAGCLIRKRYILSRNPMRLDDKPTLIQQDTLDVMLGQG